MCQSEQELSPWRPLMNKRASPGHAYVPTDVEHIANVITHGLWIMPSVAGWLWMTHISSSQAEYLTALVYGFALLSLFTVSTVFHTIAYTGICGDLKTFFHIGDRAVIYVFIAASYTPWFVLKEMYDVSWGWKIALLIWFMALLGISYQFIFHEKYKALETTLYLILGVCPSLAVFAMKDDAGLHELAIGGIIYILGVVFFKCDGILPFAHAIWHCFVFVGAMCHYYAVCRYLLKAGPIPFFDVIHDEL